MEVNYKELFEQEKKMHDYYFMALDEIADRLRERDREFARLVKLLNENGIDFQQD